MMNQEMTGNVRAGVYYQSNSMEQVQNHRIRQKKRKRKKRYLFQFFVYAIIIVAICIFAKKNIEKRFGNKINDSGNNIISDCISSVSPGLTAYGEKQSKTYCARPLPSSQEEMQGILQSRCETKSAYKEILNHQNEYPEKLLYNLAANAETLDFVLQYPKLHEKIQEQQYQEGQTLATHANLSKVPLYLQWDQRWGYAKYGDNLLGIAGCGPTCLAMVTSYLFQDDTYNPVRIANFSVEQGYLNENNDTLWSLMTEGAGKLGLQSQEVMLDKNVMISQLQEGHPIICSMAAGDFTKNGHFIVLYDYEDGLFFVNDPNSKNRSKFGYSYERLSGQINDMWSFSK